MGASSNEEIRRGVNMVALNPDRSGARPPGQAGVGFGLNTGAFGGRDAAFSGGLPGVAGGMGLGLGAGRGRVGESATGGGDGGLGGPVGLGGSAGLVGTGGIMKPTRRTTQEDKEAQRARHNFHTKNSRLKIDNKIALLGEALGVPTKKKAEILDYTLQWCQNEMSKRRPDMMQPYGAKGPGGGGGGPSGGAAASSHTGGDPSYRGPGDDQGNEEGEGGGAGSSAAEGPTDEGHTGGL